MPAGINGYLKNCWPLIIGCHLSLDFFLQLAILNSAYWMSNPITCSALLWYSYLHNSSTNQPIYHQPVLWLTYSHVWYDTAPFLFIECSVIVTVSNLQRSPVTERSRVRVIAVDIYALGSKVEHLNTPNYSGYGKSRTGVTGVVTIYHLLRYKATVKPKYQTTTYSYSWPSRRRAPALPAGQTPEDAVIHNSGINNLYRIYLHISRHNRLQIA